MKSWLIVALIVVSTLTLIALGMYFGKFHGELSDDSSKWGDFGSFITGAMSIAFGMVNIYL